MQRIGTRQKWIPVYSSSTLQILMGSDIGISLGWIKPSGLPVYSYYLQLKGCETQWRSLTGARWRSYMKWPLLTIIYNGHLSIHRIFEETLLTFNINSSVTHCLSGFLYNHRIPQRGRSLELLPQYNGKRKTKSPGSCHSDATSSNLV